MTINKKWIIADTHFNHDAMISKGIRPPDYQQRIIYNWKQYVSHNDTIIILGDIIFSRPGEIKQILSSLPGYKILVRGNHDKNSNEWYLSHGFNEVHDSYVVTVGSNKRIILTHAPVYINRKHYDYNICGHLHNYKGNNTFRHKECVMLNDRSRIYSMELEWYRPRSIEYMIDVYHESHRYLVAKGLHTIRIKYLYNSLYRFIKNKWKFITNIK